MRRFMTEDELLAALEAAAERESVAEARYNTARVAAAEPARLAKEAEARAERARVASTKALANEEARRLAEIALPLVTEAEAADRALYAARAETDELRRATADEWRRVRDALNEPRDVAKLSKPCSGSPNGSHALRAGGSTWDPKRSAYGVSLNCSQCRASVVIADAQVVRLILQALVSGGVLPELPKLVSTVDE